MVYFPNKGVSFGAQTVVTRNLINNTLIAYRILDDAPDITFEVERADLEGVGSYKGTLDSVITGFKAEGSFAVKQIHIDGIADIFGMPIIGDISANDDGQILNIGNLLGGTLFSTSSGIANVTLTPLETGNLKTGKYYVEAIDATTVRVEYDATYGSVKYEDNSLIITGADVIIPNATTVDLTDVDNNATFGVTFTGGTTVAMTPGDRGSFEVIKANKGNEIVEVRTELITDVRHEVRFYSEESANGFQVIEVPTAVMTLDSISLAVKEHNMSNLSFKSIETPGCGVPAFSLRSVLANTPECNVLTGIAS